MAGKKLSLGNIEPDEDSVLILIRSSLPSFTLCWHLNRIFNWSLSRTNDLIQQYSQQKPSIQKSLFDSEEINEQSVQSLHSTFFYHDEELYSEITLLVNKGTDAFLLKNFRKFEFILQITGPESEKFAFYQEEIKKIEHILDVAEGGKYSLTDLWAYS